MSTEPLSPRRRHLIVGGMAVAAAPALFNIARAQAGPIGAKVAAFTAQRRGRDGERGGECKFAQHGATPDARVFPFANGWTTSLLWQGKAGRARNPRQDDFSGRPSSSSSA